MNSRYISSLVLRTTLGILFLFLLSSCGGSSESGGSATSALPAAANPTLPIRTMQVTVGTATQTILTDSRGFSLYFYVPDEEQGEERKRGEHKLSLDAPPLTQLPRLSHPQKRVNLKALFQTMKETRSKAPYQCYSRSTLYELSLHLFSRPTDDARNTFLVPSLFVWRKQRERRKRDFRLACCRKSDASH